MLEAESCEGPSFVSKGSNEFADGESLDEDREDNNGVSCEYDEVSVRHTRGKREGEGDGYSSSEASPSQNANGAL